MQTVAKQHLKPELAISAHYLREFKHVSADSDETTEYMLLVHRGAKENYIGKNFVFYNSVRNQLSTGTNYRPVVS